VSRLKHYYGLNHLHYLTTSTYRRARLFDSERFRKQWVATFGELRRELEFRMNIWTPKKQDEELNYMHNNPVKRGLVKQPGDWPWSRRGGRFYFWNDASILGMDKMV
jgi:REP element-mobilizing transposase RayT